MSSGSTSGSEAKAHKAHEASHSQSTPALAHISSAHEGPVFSETSLEPMKPLRRAKSEHDILHTRQSLGRLRRQPIDPSLEQVSTKSEEEPLPRGVPPRYYVDEVFRKVLPRTEGAVKLPEFDAAGAYARSDNVVLKMWRDETNRLMEIANNPKKRIEFKSNGFLQGDTAKGYSSASNLSQRVLTAIAICLLDNECIIAEHYGQLSTRKKLFDLIEHLQKSQRTTEATASMEDREARQQEFHSLAATYSLVNYITAVLTKLIFITSPILYWFSDFMSILIRRTTKIKLLLLDLQANSAISARAAKAALSRFPESCDTQHHGGELNDEECDDYIRMIETNEKEGIASYEETRVTTHCLEQTKCRLRLNSALRDMVMSVRIGTKLCWWYDNELTSPYDTQYLRLNSMDQVITVLIPLATMSPAFLAALPSSRHAMFPIGVKRPSGQSLFEEEGFGSFFRLCTREFDDNLNDMRGALRFWQARWAGVFDQGYCLPLFVPWKIRLTLAKSLEKFKKRTRRLDVENRHMRQWVIDEKSVMVPCPGYVWSVIAVASLLAGAGLGIGFSVGQRIRGVDPSNLATYLWVVAAFIVLIAKNMKVNEWTWNDFLRRRVRCRSVSELQSITGIDGQIIIAKLLHDERRGSVLNICGPYNSAFLRRANEGFSIDEPIDSSTLFNSGLLMLRVATARGHALTPKRSI
ncbi:hypothetical protein KVR01_008412 [Diaporthe batatas]|uniref:uncharacterized protein n=1 Tax=Diaporthe batatas TaxID=748121 RepID=UPI001D048E06|nr:uncharacterized protein KVR01_008412 [Diaporthe batatas]KAG8161425.1 hypothetical protein KVR01_008412 [Diaporthe batatas]